MRIKKIISQYRRDFQAVYECEHNDRMDRYSSCRSIDFRNTEAEERW